MARPSARAAAAAAVASSAQQERKCNQAGQLGAYADTRLLLHAFRSGVSICGEAQLAPPQSQRPPIPRHREANTQADGQVHECRQMSASACILLLQRMRRGPAPAAAAAAAARSAPHGAACTQTGQLDSKVHRSLQWYTGVSTLNIIASTAHDEEHICGACCGLSCHSCKHSTGKLRSIQTLYCTLLRSVGNPGAPQ